METAGKKIVENVRKMQQPGAPFTKPAEVFARREKGVASIFLIEVGEGAKAYRYDVDISIHTRNYATGEAYSKSLAKGADEGQRSRNRLLCYELLTVAYQKLDNQRGFFAATPGEIVYDMKSTMYTSEPVNITEIETVEINWDETEDYVRRYCGSSRFTVTIRDSGQTLDITNLQQYIDKTSIYQEDRSVRTFLEMAIAQNSFNDNSYTAIGAGELFEKADDRVIKFGCGMVLRPGVSKGVRIVQNFGNPCPALVIDTKVSAFFDPIPLIDTVRAICNNRYPRNPQDWERVEKIVKDIRVEAKFQRNRTFTIKALSAQTADRIFVTFEGNRMTLVEYYRDHKNHLIQDANQLRVVIPDYVAAEDSPDHYFPLELVSVMEDQRVALEKQDRALSQRLLTVNSVIPAKRMEDTLAHVKRLGLFRNDNPVLKAFKLRVIEDSNQCDIGVRHPPQIKFAQDKIVAPGGPQNDWRKTGGMRFCEGAKVKKWVVMRDPANDDDVRPFVQKFLQAAGRRGMNFAPPTYKTFGADQWYPLFDDFHDTEVEFVMLIDSLKEDTHGPLKYFEARYKIVTQHITLEKASQVAHELRGMQTLENIINKTNCKLFGINYVPVFENSASRFALERGDTLVIAYDVAHPPPLMNVERRMVQQCGLKLLSFDPSVIGITANMAVHPHNFVGDYYYQEACRDQLDLFQLSERFHWVLRTIEQNRPSAKKPKYIFVLRNGLSEGQFATSVEMEMQALRDGCRDYDPDYKPQFVYVLGTKRHYKKFYALRGDRIENMAPGSVVSTKFVREDCPELFMMSHFPLKGVGKAVEYNILVNDIDITQDELQGLLNSLCYTHQIVNSAVSLPAPVYQADELAKRGRNNYMTMKLNEESEIPRQGPHNLVDYAKLNNILGYRFSDLRSTRFTA